MEGEPSSQKRERSGETDFVQSGSSVEKIRVSQSWMCEAVGVVFFFFFLFFQGTNIDVGTLRKYLYVQVKFLWYESTPNNTLKQLFPYIVTGALKHGTWISRSTDLKKHWITLSVWSLVIILYNYIIIFHILLVIMFQFPNFLKERGQFYVSSSGWGPATEQRSRGGSVDYRSLWVLQGYRRLWVHAILFIYLFIFVLRVDLIWLGLSL